MRRRLTTLVVLAVLSIFASAALTMPPDAVAQGTVSIELNRGDDDVRGGRADDTLSGGAGTDVCAGNFGTDTATTCETVFGVP